MSSNAVLRALAEPRRPAMLRLVRDEARSVGEIASHFDITQQAVSQHLGVLKAAGLVVVTKQGTKRLYRARPEGLAPLRALLEELWDDRLGALKREAEREERGTMHATTETIAIEREVHIDARPETVWAFLTEPEKLCRWMGMNAVLDPRPGGTYEVEVCPGSVARGEFVSLDPPHRLVWTWGWEPGMGSDVAPGSTTIEVELIPTDGATTLRFRHSGLPDEAAAASHAHGWEHYLPRLALAGGGGDPGVDPWISRPPSQAG